ncbi:hypothetical protein T440DRAFT_481021 [Plenodomus tracheiphilus IPT5]|uniref:Uncharacterized protein n=1 Tax=Plenodomus tracheiphilus IPT5 TaxID=1408161 RepID=A0A6A7AYS3_9PLEO|nr:hypothetical protein T440DRAFT_481021 [Plenodomus tracheiphilus IPT5]
MNRVGLFKELADNLGKFGRDPDEECFSRIFYTDSKYGRDWLIQSALMLPLHPQAQSWLEALYEPQPSLFGHNPERARETPAVPTMQHCNRVGDYKAIVDVVKFKLEFAMTVVDIWAYAPLLRRKSYSVMPEFKWYCADMVCMMRDFERELGDAFSQYSWQFRDRLSNVNIERLYKECWQLADEESRHLLSQDIIEYYRQEEIIFRTRQAVEWAGCCEIFARARETTHSAGINWPPISNDDCLPVWLSGICPTLFDDTQPAPGPEIIQVQDLRLRMYKRVLDKISLVFPETTESGSRIAATFGCHWQRIDQVYAGSYDIVDAGYAWGISCLLRPFSVERLNTCPGMKFYGDTLVHELGPEVAESDSEYE